MNTKIHIGLDVHKNSITVAYALADGSEPQHHGRWGGTNLSAERGLLKLLKKLGASKADLRICYEAGPTGFVLARRPPAARLRLHRRRAVGGAVGLR